MSEQQQYSRWWHRRARRVALRVGAGWWLDRFAPGMLCLSGTAAVAVTAARSMGGGVAMILWSYAGAAVVMALASLPHGRRRGFKIDDGLVRLDVVHRLHNALSAAQAGVGAWPKPLDAAGDGLRWRLPRPAGQILSGVALLALALALPLRPEPAEAAYAVEEPAAWRQVEEWLNTLEEEKLVEPASIEELRRQVEALRQQPMETWYEHSSVEAGDSLGEQVRHDIKEFQRNLEMAFAGATALERLPEDVPDSLMERWQQQMGESIEGLSKGDLRMDPELLRQLKSMELDPSKLRSLTEEEWKQLKEALERGLEACSACTGRGTNEVLVLVEGLCEGGGQGPPRLGAAGISRGPGTVPLTLSDQATALEGGRVEQITGGDLSRAALGDVLAVTEREHEIDESLYTGPRAAGAVDSAATGGEMVWQQPLDPDERRVVQEFFD